MTDSNRPMLLCSEAGFSAVDCGSPVTSGVDRRPRRRSTWDAPRRAARLDGDYDFVKVVLERLVPERPRPTRDAGGDQTGEAAARRDRGVPVRPARHPVSSRELRVGAPVLRRLAGHADVPPVGQPKSVFRRADGRGISTAQVR
jgi:hypothetical protein